MTHTHQIIVGVDGSEAGQRALDWAVAEAARRNRVGEPTGVRAITVYQRLTSRSANDVGFDDPAVAAEDIVTEAVAMARRLDATVALVGDAVCGSAAEALGNACVAADLLVLGSHGHSRLRTAVLGSVSEACVRVANCPVLIVPARRTVPVGSAVPALTRPDGVPGMA
jgi:nucleotide-binding universal stress UspA family protein